MTFRRFAINNVFRNKRTYAAYFCSSAFSVMIFFVYAMFIFHPGVEEGVTKQVAISGMKAAEVIIYVFSYLFILYSVGAFLKSRSREFGILMMHGMSRRQLNHLVFIENMLIGFLAIISGMVVGLVFGKVFLMVGARIMDVKDLTFYLSWKPIALTFFSFIVLFLIISLATSVFIRGNQLIELLKGSAKPKKEPKSSVLVSLGTAVLLIASYYLAVTTTEDNIAYRILVVPFMTIVATYFLYAQLSVFLLRLLKKNKAIYWRKTRLITISDLAYKMKDNARMFFFVTIVSTVAFCAVGSLAAMSTMDQEMRIQYPLGVSYVSSPGNHLEVKHLAMIEQDLHERHLKSQLLTLKVKTQTSTQSGQEVQLISNSAYNRFAKTLRFAPIQLNGDEAKLMPNGLQQVKNFEHKKMTVTLKESGTTLRVNGVTKQVLDNYMLPNAIVIPDPLYQKIHSAKTANELSYHHDTYYGFYVKDWVKTNGVGASIQSESMNDNGDGPQKYMFESAGTNYVLQHQTYSVMFFIGLLVGVVFFIAAGSFLYFRLYTDLGRDSRQYRAVSKIGMSEKELGWSATTQLGLLFFIPIIVAIVHSAFAFVALQSLFNLSIVSSTLWVLGGFAIAQILYFLLIRSLYLRHLKEAIA